MPAVALDLRGVCHAYPDGTAALCGVDLHIEAGECVALLGANGAGKSTLLQHLNGLLLAAAGEVWVDGQRVEPASLARVRQLVGYVFQQAEDQLFMPTVAEDVAFGPHNLGLGAAEVEARVQQALQAVGASHLAGRAPWRLSGGEQRLVAIAGVLAMRPGVLVLDEPSAGLDAQARGQLLKVLAAQTCTRIVTTHDLALAAELCPRALVLHEGRVRADGAPRDLYADAALMRECRLVAISSAAQ